MKVKRYSKHMRYLEKESLARRFIDPSDWNKAKAYSPRSPWKYYLKPKGSFKKEAWRNFCAAARFIQKRAIRNRRIGGTKEILSLKDILATSAFINYGRRPRPSDLPEQFTTYSTLNTKQIKDVFKNCTTKYKNNDNLDIRIAGFWPINKDSLEFVCLICKLRKLASFNKPKESSKIAFKIQRFLYSRADKKSRYWHCYSLLSYKKRIDQMKQIIKWYNIEANKILRTSIFKSKDYRKKVTTLAAKLQRYVDITHLCMDGSGRLSRFMQDYVFLRFGLRPQVAPCLKYRKHYYHFGTYLPEEKAIKNLGA